MVQDNVFFELTDEADAFAVMRTFVPSVCAEEPSLLHRSAVNFVSEGGEYASTVIVLLVLAVRPRESVTVAVSVSLPAVFSVLEVNDALE